MYINLEVQQKNIYDVILLNYRQSHIYALRTKRHNKAVWALRKLIVLSKHSRCYILMNARRFNDNLPENTVPSWLLPYTCSLQRCHYNARFKPDIICVKGLPYQANPPTTPENNLKIQFIEFTYYNDMFLPETITRKTEKYQPFIDSGMSLHVFNGIHVRPRGIFCYPIHFIFKLEIFLNI